jgi:hypothetical protein
MSNFFRALAIFALVLVEAEAVCAKGESKLVTRIETVKASLKGGKLTIEVTGMAVTGGTMMPKSGSLVRRGTAPNADGLLEYELRFDAPPNAKDKLEPVKASTTERSIPEGVKGVRIYAEFNEMNRLLPEPKIKASPAKEKTPAPSPTRPPSPRKELAAPSPAPPPTPPPKKEKRPAPKKEVAKSTPTPTPQPVVKEKKKQSWNPFHRKHAEPTPSPEPSVSPTPALVKKESQVKKAPPLPAATPLPKKIERAPAKVEEAPRPTATPSPSPNEKKKKSRLRYLNPLHWNPFHHEKETPAADQSAPPQ